MTAPEAQASGTASASAEGALWLLVERYVGAMTDCAANPEHESAKAYAQLAKSELQDALASAEHQRAQLLLENQRLHRSNTALLAAKHKAEQRERETFESAQAALSTVRAG